MPALKLLGVLNKLGAALTAELDVERLVNLIVESGVNLTGAQFGAFFYHTESDADGKRLMLVAVHGAPKEAFMRFGIPSHTPMLTAHLVPGVKRCDDVLADPLYGLNEHGGVPKGHLPVRSYLAVPVSSRKGQRIGSLLFGHSDPGKFTAEHEQIVTGLSSMGSVAMDNSKLYSEAQREIRERAEAEKQLRSALERQKLLLDELNHRVKNTLTTIQAIAIQTRNSISKQDNATIDLFYDAFEARLLSLSRAHDLLVLGAWVGVSLNDAIRAAIYPSIIDFSRVTIVCDKDITLSPNAVVTMNMVFHELATNALKYGALSDEVGLICITATRSDNDTVSIEWVESGGPVVLTPNTSGFGTRLIERGAMRELGGTAKLCYDPDGLKCKINIPVSAKVSVVS